MVRVAQGYQIVTLAAWVSAHLQGIDALPGMSKEFLAWSLSGWSKSMQCQEHGGERLASLGANLVAPRADSRRLSLGSVWA